MINLASIRCARRHICAVMASLCFAVSGFGAVYYVNDSSTSNDLWCTAIGSDANDGLTPSTPKASVQNVIDTYVLQGGDQVRMDTGLYNLTNDITVTSADSGVATALVSFVASPYGVVIDRNDPNSPAAGFFFNGAQFVQLTTTNSTALPSVPQQFLQVTGGARGVRIAGGGCVVTRVEAVSNQFQGVYVEGSSASNAVLEQLLVRQTYDPASGAGLLVSSASRATIRNVTTTDNGRYGIRLVSATLAHMTNNIAVADGAGDVALAIESGATLSGSDYNLFFVTNSAVLATLGGTNYNTLARWRAISGRDTRSLEAPPLFVAPNIGNYQLQSTAGSYSLGSFTSNLADSPGLDTGFGDVGLETVPNQTPLHPATTGKRNLGAYGGTEFASRTPTNRLLHLYEPIRLDQYLNPSTPVTIRWTWVGTDWNSGDATVNLQYFDESNTYSNIAGASAVAVNDGSFSWTISGLLPAPIYQVRLVRNIDATAGADSGGPFRIGRNIVYYVNDAATAHDLWATSAGNDFNHGLTPAAPKTTVQSVLNAYDLDGGDQVRIDTGTYVLTNDITVTSLHSGVATAPVSFVASPYGVTFNRNDTNTTSACWHFNGVKFAQLTTTNDSSLAGIAQRYAQLTGARYGIWFAGSDNRMTRIEAFSNSVYGAFVNGAAASNTVIENALLRETLDPTGAGLQISTAARTTARNCTLVGNGKYGIRLISSTLTHLTNNILVADGVNDFAISLESSSTLAGSDYNLLLGTNGAFLGSLNGTNYTTLTAWRTASNNDSHSLTYDPVFVSPATGNYRLQSTSGSYKTTGFTVDANTSPGIDTGFGDAGLETAPNSSPLHPSPTGKRNLGAYGGTEFASRTPTDRFVWLYEPIGGEQYLNQTAPVTVRWTWVGTDWSSGDQTLTLQHYNETDAFMTVPGATNLNVSTGSYTWDIGGLLPAPLYRVRLLRNLDAGLAAQSATAFRVGRAITYYVNDSSLANDLWASAAGNDLNNGLTPGAPKATVQSVLDTYDLDGGDQVRLDTGTYNLTNDITILSSQSGVATALVSFIASPYGVTINRGNTNAPSAAWYLNGAQYVQLTTTNDSSLVGVPQRWLRLTTGARGVRVTGFGCVVSRIEAVSNAFQGVYLDGSASSNNVIENCLIFATSDLSAGTGILLSGGARNTIRNCTVTENSKYGMRLVGATLVNLTNNIVTADGPGSFGISMESGSTLAGADFNLWHTTNNALLASLNGTNLATLAAWRAASGRDARSLQGNPLFVSPSTANYRLQSTAGSYKISSFTPDDGDSPGIDTGFGDSGLETAPSSTPLHGATTGKRNLGAYGGTELASRTPTNRLVWLYEPIGREEYLNQASPVSVRWTWVGTDWSTGDQTLCLQYLNEFESYITLPLATNIAVNTATYSWDISSVLPTPIYRARIIRNFDAALVAASTAPFRIGRAISYYVNDSSTSNDLWASAMGNDTNNGLTPAFPKATAQAVLDTYDLDGGDQIRLDTGTYFLTNDITVTAQDSGVSTAWVSFIASPYGVTFQRNETNLNSAAWYFNGASFVQLTTTNDSSLAAPQRFAQVTGGRYGVWVAGNDCRITRMDAVSNLFYGVYISGAIGSNTVVENSLLRDNYDSTGAGFYVASAARATARNCTFVNNTRYGIRLVGATLAALTNNVFVAGGTNNSAVSIESGASLAGSDYNLWYLTNGAHLGFINNAKVTSLAAWRTTTGQDAHSLERDPLFVDASTANFNAQSTAGSYKAGTFTADAADSPIIDTGWGSVGLETAPNLTPLHGANTGKRNLGAFGGTEFASLTPTNRLLWLYEPVGNEYYLNQDTNISVRWTWVGTDWDSGDQTVGIRYFNEYENFVTIPAASNLTVSTGQHSWNISGLLPTPIYRAQLLRNFDLAIADTSTAPFRIGRVVTYYVNDSSTSNDLWTVAPGADSHNALTPGFAKATVQSVLDIYDLDPGDQVRIDTGTYLLTNDITVTAGDSGAATAVVSFVASPYGVTFNRNETNFNTACWYFNGAQNTRLTTTNDATLAGVPQRWLQVTGARYGVWLASPENQVSRMEAVSNLFFGVYVNGAAASNNVIENAILRDNYDSTGAGAYVSSATRTTIRNSTLVGNGRYGLRGITTTLLQLTNNIISASGPAGIGISLESGTTLAGSDYNLWFTTNNAILGHLSGTNYTDMVAWRNITGLDLHSFERSPLFVDPATGNYHVQSTAGSYKGATFTADPENSIAIDTGFGEAGLEPAVNATPLHGSSTGRRNLGAYGGTELASLTPTNRLAWLYEPLGRASYLNQAIPIPIRWTWVGTDWNTGDQSLNLQYFNEYANFVTVDLGTNIAVSASNFTWNISGLLPTPIYRIQLTRNSDSTPTDLSAQPFRIGRNIVYYVNDDAPTNDLWCTASGDDAHNGLTPAFPKATAQSVLDTYDLDGGDSIRFDTGLYHLTNDITVTSADSGVATALVSFIASPYGVTFNRGNTNGTAACWFLNGVSFVHLTTTNDSSLPAVPQRYLQLTGAARGFYSAGPGNRLSRCDAVSNLFHGAVLIGSAASNNVVENCLLRESVSPTSGHGFYSDAARTTVRNCTIVGNGRYGLRLVGATLASLTNNILVADGAGDITLAVESGATLAGSDYNLFWATNSATLAALGGTNYTSLAAWRTASGRDLHSLVRDPLFVSPAAGNYRLQSTAGSYKTTTFTADFANSPGLDTGFGDVGLETAPNTTPLHGSNTGKRNLGAYGGTELASLTPTNRLVWLYEPSGSEQYPISGGPIPIRWTWVGTDWTGGNTLAIDYRNSEISFTNVIGAGAIAVDAGSFSWDITVLQRDPAFQVRLTSNDSGTTTDITPAPFAIGGKLLLYVNDSSLVNDKWVNAIGNDANDGAAPNRPKATLQNLLAAYDLQPGDEVYVDTGIYNLTNDIVIAAADGGTDSNPVRFTGSTRGSGTILNRGTTTGNSAVFDSAASGLILQDFRLTGAARGYVHSGTARGNQLINTFIYANTRGIEVVSTNALTILNCTIADNTVAGIDATATTNTPTIINTILWNNNDDLVAATAIYSLIEDGDAGLGNTASNPAFINAAARDYRILGASAAIDAGTNVPSLLPTTDIEDQARIFAGIVDIGADERPWAVSVSANTNSIYDSASTPATLTFTRDGSYHREITVPFTITGTASNGVDYALITSPVTITNGGSTASIQLTPTDDLLLEGPETATFTLSASAIYNLTNPTSATVTLTEAPADVLANKTGPTLANASGTIHYTITITNAGPGIALGVAVMDSLPNGVTFQSASGGGTNAAGIVGWPTLSALTVGTSTNFTVTVTAPTAGVLTNIVTSTTGTTDPVAGNNNGTSSNSVVVTTITELADVQATKSGPPLIDAGSPLTYTITVTNAGPSAASNVAIADTLPVGVTFLAASHGGTNAAGIVGWPLLPTLAQHQVVTYTVTVIPPGAGILSNTIASTSTTIDLVPGNNDGSSPDALVTTVIHELADVVATKTGLTNVYFGDNITYTITVTNTGPSSAQNVMVADILPVGVNFLTASGGGTNVAGTIGWPVISSLPIDASTNFYVSVATTAIGEITNIVTSSSITDDPNAGNNNGTGLDSRVVTRVNHIADVVALKTGPALVLPGTNITYQLTITNAGPTVATNVTVVDLLPGAVTFVEASAGGTNAGGVVGWPLIGELPAGSETNFSVTVTAPLTGVITNQVVAAAAVNDPDPGNNDGTAPVSTAITVIDMAADSDGDGLPDWWEMLYGLNPNDNTDAGLDSDGDGYTNRQEYLAGTSPASSIDALRITAIYISDDDIYIRFTTAPGKQYQVQYRDDLETGTWETLPGLIDGNGSPKEGVDPGGASAGRQFYRVLLYIAP
jgi:uncharacterized repeat protein (TIGR01451 family)